MVFSFFRGNYCFQVIEEKVIMSILQGISDYEEEEEIIIIVEGILNDIFYNFQGFSVIKGM